MPDHRRERLVVGWNRWPIRGILRGLSRAQFDAVHLLVHILHRHHAEHDLAVRVPGFQLSIRVPHPCKFVNCGHRDNDLAIGDQASDLLQHGGIGRVDIQQHVVTETIQLGVDALGCDAAQSLLESWAVFHRNHADLAQVVKTVQAGGADYPRSASFGQLPCDDADTAVRCMDQHCATRAGGGTLDRLPGRRCSNIKAAGDLPGQALRLGDHIPRRHGDKICLRTTHRVAEHRLAGFPPGDARSDTRDEASEVATLPRREASGPLLIHTTFPNAGLARVQARSHDLDDHLTRTRNGGGHLDEIENFRAPIAGELH